jgi:hypothetical protein
MLISSHGLVYRRGKMETTFQMIGKGVSHINDGGPEDAKEKINACIKSIVDNLMARTIGDPNLLRPDLVCQIYYEDRWIFGHSHRLEDLLKQTDPRAYLEAYYNDRMWNLGLPIGVSPVPIKWTFDFLGGGEQMQHSNGKGEFTPGYMYIHTDTAPYHTCIGIAPKIDEITEGVENLDVALKAAQKLSCQYCVDDIMDKVQRMVQHFVGASFEIRMMVIGYLNPEVDKFSPELELRVWDTINREDIGSEDDINNLKEKLLDRLCEFTFPMGGPLLPAVPHSWVILPHTGGKEGVL